MIESSNAFCGVCLKPVVAGSGCGLCDACLGKALPSRYLFEVESAPREGRWYCENRHQRIFFRSFEECKAHTELCAESFRQVPLPLPGESPSSDPSALLVSGDPLEAIPKLHAAEFRIYAVARSLAVYAAQLDEKPQRNIEDVRHIADVLRNLARSLVK